MNDKRSDSVPKPSHYLTSWTPTSSVLRSYENCRSQRPVREVCVCVFDVMPLMLLHCTHQGVEHQRVIGVLLRGLHHDVEQGVQSVLQKLCVKQKQLQKLHHSKKRDAIFDFYLTLTISPPSTSISLCRFWSRSSGLDLQFNRPSKSTEKRQRSSFIKVFFKCTFLNVSILA